MRPPPSVARRMRVAFLIGMAMMFAMRGYPEQGTALPCQYAAPRQEILEPFRRLIPSVSEQPVVSHPNSPSAGNPQQGKRYPQPLPGEKQQRGNRARVI